MGLMDSARSRARLKWYERELLPEMTARQAAIVVVALMVVIGGALYGVARWYYSRPGCHHVQKLCLEQNGSGFGGVIEPCDVIECE